MNARQKKIGGGLLVVVALCVAAELASHAQQPQRPSGTRAAQPAAASAGSSASMDAERAQIWNSPNMLRARAWLQEYCQTSAKVKPGEGQIYMNELQNMTPTQMKLWLFKFDEEEEAKQQQQQLWKEAHSAALKQAMAANRATQQSYAAINTEESEAAGEEQQQLNIQQADEQEMAADKQLGPDGVDGIYPGDGVHYHFHLYPY
jgi:hypothetical protein